MAGSLSNLLDNLAEGIHKIKCKYEPANKKCKICGVKYKDCECCVEYTNAKGISIIHKYLCCKTNIDKLFFDTAKRCLPIGTHEWTGKFDEASLPEEENFYSNINIEDISL